MADAVHTGSWKIRRRFMFATHAFCMYCIWYVMRYGADTKVNEAIVTCAFICMGGTLGSYVFGAVWQDINVGKIKKE